LAYFCIHFGNFIVGEIAQKWQWRRQLEWGENAGAPVVKYC
jgi:hypothetical protein